MSKKQSKKTRPDLSKEDNEFFIPADDEDWNQQAARLKLQFTGMADLPQDCLASGSETTDGQFMTYRGHKVPLDNATVFESRRKNMASLMTFGRKQIALLEILTSWTRS